MSKRGIRSPQGKNNQELREIHKNIRYAFKNKIRQESWKDNREAETICRTSYQSLVTFGYEQYKEDFSTTLVPDIDCGYITYDARGRGTEQ